MTTGELRFALGASLVISLLLLIASLPASSLGDWYLLGLCVWVWLFDLLIAFEIRARRKRVVPRPHAFGNAPPPRNPS